MSRYIDADALIRDIATIDGRRLSTATIGMAIDSAPSIDLVRCKECKHWQKSRERAVMCCMREAPNRPMVADDFCSYGERGDAE